MRVLVIHIVHNVTNQLTSHRWGGEGVPLISTQSELRSRIPRTGCDSVSVFAPLLYQFNWVPGSGVKIFLYNHYTMKPLSSQNLSSSPFSSSVGEIGSLWWLASLVCWSVCTDVPQLFNLNICLKPVGIPLQSDHSTAGYCHLQNATVAVSYNDVCFVYVILLHSIPSMSPRGCCGLSHNYTRRRIF